MCPLDLTSQMRSQPSSHPLPAPGSSPRRHPLTVHMDLAEAPSLFVFFALGLCPQRLTGCVAHSRQSVKCWLNMECSPVLADTHESHPPAHPPGSGRCACLTPSTWPGHHSWGWDPKQNTWPVPAITVGPRTAAHQGGAAAGLRPWPCSIPVLHCHLQDSGHSPGCSEARPTWPANTKPSS